MDARRYDSDGRGRGVGADLCTDEFGRRVRSTTTDSKSGKGNDRQHKRPSSGSGKPREGGKDPKSSQKRPRHDYEKVVPGYSAMSEAAKVKARMNYNLRVEAAFDADIRPLGGEPTNRQWIRKELDPHAAKEKTILKESPVGQGPRPQSIDFEEELFSLMPKIQTQHLTPEQAHEAAIFGVGRGCASGRHLLLRQGSKAVAVWFAFASGYSPSASVANLV